MSCYKFAVCEIFRSDKSDLNNIVTERSAPVSCIQLLEESGCSMLLELRPHKQSSQV